MRKLRKIWHCWQFVGGGRCHPLQTVQDCFKRCFYYFDVNIGFPPKTLYYGICLCICYHILVISKPDSFTTSHTGYYWYEVPGKVFKDISSFNRKTLVSSRNKIKVLKEHQILWADYLKISVQLVDYYQFESFKNKENFFLLNSWKILQLAAMRRVFGS